VYRKKEEFGQISTSQNARLIAAMRTKVGGEVLAFWRWLRRYLCRRQNPSPMTDTTRPHRRIEQIETQGRRVELKA
jgi:hypothetical protein